MATTVGDTLASSKLAVAQDDLHLAGSSVDQLTVQFNQLAFDEFLASDRNGPNKKTPFRRLPTSNQGGYTAFLHAVYTFSRSRTSPYHSAAPCASTRDRKRDPMGVT